MRILTWCIQYFYWLLGLIGYPHPDEIMLHDMLNPFLLVGYLQCVLLWATTLLLMVTGGLWVCFAGLRIVVETGFHHARAQLCRRGGTPR